MENEKPKRLTKFKFLFTKCFPSKLPKYSECEHHMVGFHEKNFAMQSAKEFLKFVDSSPSPFHAVEQSIKKLIAQGYTEIQEQDKWQLKNSGKYFFTRNRSAVVAFNVGKEYKQGNGFAILGAHTDSPCLKVKPKSKKDKFGYKQVGVELYGGGLWHTWFDRDLGLAGRVLVEKNGVFEHSLVNISKAILRIPTLAIHLTKDRDGFTFNKEEQLVPILSQTAEAELNKPAATVAGSIQDKHHTVMLEMIAKELGCKVENIRDFELCLYDTQKASIGGASDEFLHSARLDNLMMSFCALEALTESKDSGSENLIRVICLFDNEEVGSNTAHGADSNLLEVTLRRLAGVNFNGPIEESAYERAMTRSLLISADMAHALHPNYASIHEENHRPSMNQGVVIKQNANQRYATTAITTLILREIAKLSNVNLQEFVVRNDSPCGSTIGPMLSAKLGLRTVDVGNPQWSMHSIRETCGTGDIGDAIKLFKCYFECFDKIDAKIPKN